MAIGIGSDSIYTYAPGMASDQTNTDALTSKLNNKNATDKDLMSACKNFESYLLEQVFKGMEKTVDKEEEQGAYMDQFGDMLYEQYAKSATENQSLGIAQILYDSLKRNSDKDTSSNNASNQTVNTDQPVNADQPV